MMQCPLQQKDTAEILLDYCARKLKPETSALLDRHLAVCHLCREFTDGQRMIWEALDSWESAPISTDFDRKLYARIDAHEASSWWKRLSFGNWSQPFGWKPAMPLATACLTIVAAMVLYFPSSRKEPDLTVSKPVVVESPQADLDQVERTLEDMEMLRQLGPPAPHRNL
jgi:hypothetical protein